MHPTRILLLALCIPLHSCADDPLLIGPEERAQESRAPEEAPTKPILLKGDRLGDSQGTGPRLSHWPNQGSRWQLQTERAGTLEFELGEVNHRDQPQALDMLSFEEDWFIIRIGPVGEWYRNDSLYLLIDVETRAVHAAGVYEYSDLGGGQWGTVHGNVRIDPAIGPAIGPGSNHIRGAFNLFHDDARSAPWFQGTFEVSTSDPSPNLREDLESFGVSFLE